MSWIDQIGESIVNLFHDIEETVCENTGLACDTDLSKRSEKADKVELNKLPHVQLKELTVEREPVVGCYIQMHQVGCYETFIEERRADPKIVNETLEKIDREPHNEMIIMRSARLKKLAALKEIQQFSASTPPASAPAPQKSNLPPPGCLPGTVGP